MDRCAVSTVSKYVKSTGAKRGPSTIDGRVYWFNVPGRDIAGLVDEYHSRSLALHKLTPQISVAELLDLMGN